MPKLNETRTENFIFQGFQKPNYTPVPDEFFDELMERLSSPEIIVLLYIIRRTFGFKKDTDNISLSQICRGITTKQGKVLDKGTGLSKSTVALALKGILQKNIILAQRNQSKEKGNEPTTYGLNFIGTPLSAYWTRGVPKIGQGLSASSDTQETVLQETVIKNVNVIKNNNNVSPSKKTSNKSPLWHLNSEEETHNREGQAQGLALYCLDIFKDQHSFNFYLKAGRLLSTHHSEIRNLADRIRTDIINNPRTTMVKPASLFTKKLIELAGKYRVDLRANNHPVETPSTANEGFPES